MENKITVKEFVDKYNNVPKVKQIEYVSRFITKKYLNYEDKISMCNRIVKSSSYRIDSNGKTDFKHLHFNSTSRYMLYKLNLVDAYTDIKIDFSHSVEEFNLLKSNFILDIILKCIPECEIEETNYVMEMIINDLKENEYNIHSYISKQIDKITLAIRPFLSMIVNNIDYEKMKTVMNIVSKK